jgi:hypothetical protein
MTEDKPDQPDFAAIVKKPAFKLDCRDTDRTVISIDTAEQLLEDLWKDYVLPVKEENKQLREAVIKGQWVKATDRLPQHMIYQYVKVNGGTYTAYYDYSLKKFLLNVGDRGFDISEVQWLDESELSKKVEPINSEQIQLGILLRLEAAVGRMKILHEKKWIEVDEMRQILSDNIERAESTPLPKQEVCPTCGKGKDEVMYCSNSFHIMPETFARQDVKNMVDIARKTGHQEGYRQCQSEFANLKKSTPLEPVKSEWISVKERPLVNWNDEHDRWECTKDGEREFMACVELGDGTFWIKHCVIEDKIGLCVVGETGNEPAGWEIEDVEWWQPLPSPPIE